MANGATRVILSENVGQSQSALNSAFKNENEVVKGKKEFVVKDATKKHKGTHQN